MEKHTVYFNIRDEILLPGCFMCNIINKNTKKYFDDLLYEKTTDWGTAAEIEKSKGFCNRHAAFLVDIGDAMGSAIIYQYALKKIMDSFKKKHGSNIIAEFETYVKDQRINCPACVHEKETFERYSLVFADFAGEFFEILTENKNSFLCMKHFINLGALLKRRKNPLLKKFCEVQKIKLGIMSENIEKLIESYNFTLPSKVLTENEKISWIRCIECISGMQPKNIVKKFGYK